jgi:hypothetical protein
MSSPSIVVRRDINDLDEHLILVDPIDHSILLIQPGRSAPLPLTAQPLIVEFSDRSQPGWSGDTCDARFPITQVV